eukprot:c27638_g4_i1 orf=496-1692(+)
MGRREFNAIEGRVVHGSESTVKSRLSKDNTDSLRGVQEASPNLETTVTSFAPSPMDELILDQRWLIEPRDLFVGGKIGQGAHGKVYEGRYHNMSVAVKVLRRAETPADQRKLEARFAREVEMMARVQHPNLVKFIGACKEPLMAIASELLPGLTLRKHMLSVRPKQLELRIAISFALDIAQAMDCLHANGIIHRDLKPDNLLLTPDMKSVKLVDFGLAREESVAEMMTAETGTYRWMAPELYSTVTLQQGNKKYYNKKVDVYSFGIVLWELLTNRMPFEGMSNLQAAYAAAFKNARPSLPDGLPEDLVFILQSCWEEIPNNRPQFGQLVRMLTDFLSTLPGAETLAPQQAHPTKKSSCFELPNTRMVKEEMLDNTFKPRRLFSFLGQCFASRAASDLE